ncbi:MAG: GAF domain-containing protein [Chloroflexi bacterium]|nr:GAF domain-containing protein [Chloroflexota bacterium]
MAAEAYATLYHASRQIAKAETEEVILRTTANAIQQAEYVSALYVPNQNILKLAPGSSALSYLDRVPVELSISRQRVEKLFESSTPKFISDVHQSETDIPSQLLAMPRALACEEAAYLPLFSAGELKALIILSSSTPGEITETNIQPYASLAELVTIALEKVHAVESTQKRINDLEVLNEFSQAIALESDKNQLFKLIHEQILHIMGEVDFYIALYDSATEHITFPYVFELGKVTHINPIPLGEGLTSTVISTRRPLMLVEDTAERAKALGAKVIGESAESWLGVPLLVDNEAFGVITVQDLKVEHRFDEDDLRLMSTLASQMAVAIHKAGLIAESKQYALHLQTASEIARDASGTLKQDVLLKNAVNLVSERFGFYHASIFLLDNAKEYAVIKQATGDIGQQMVQEEYKHKVGSTSVVGYVTAIGEPLVVNDVSEDPNFKFNHLLPNTRAELGIPLKSGERVLGALNVQSERLFSFSPADVEVLRILADQLTVAVANTELFAETQEHLAQHRLVHHVTSVAASSTNINDAISSSVQGLRVTLGDRVAILLLNKPENKLELISSSGYEDDILGMEIDVGKGITGWVAANKKALIINDVREDPRYIPGKDSVLSELAVPLIYRDELLGVLNVESDETNAFDDHDREILSTMASSLSSIIVNTRLSESQTQLFEVTDKIRQSIDMKSIMKTTTDELNRILNTRRVRIEINLEAPTKEPVIEPGSENGKEEIE